MSYLFDLARNNDYPQVTEAALSRWRRLGLLPEGLLERRGRHGTRRLFPPAAGPQLLALCHIHYTLGERRIRYVAWRLWRQGYPVKLELVREFLLPIAREWEAQLDHVREADEAELQRLVAEAANSRLRDSHGAGLRKRVGRDDFPELVRAMFGVIRGEQMDRKASSLFVRGFGLKRGWTDFVWQDDARMLGSVDEIIRLAPRLLSTPLPALVETATAEELIRVRDVFGLHIEALATLGRVLGRWVARDAFGLGVISEILESLDPAAEAGLMLIGLAALRTTDVDPALIEAEQGWVRRGVRAAEAIEGLIDLVPDLRPLMSARRFQASLRFREAAERRLIEVGKISAPHRAAITAYISSDPSLDELNDETG